MGLYNFEGIGQNELPFKAGDMITVLDKEGEWYLAELNGRRGYVPANYISFR